jgi:xanthine dehydrogenase YagS FAD-binding subunit
VNNFRVAEPQSVDQAFALLEKGGERTFLMSGGTDLLGQIKEGITEPDLVVDLRTIPGLSFIKKEADGVRVGVLTPVVDLASDPLIKQAYPVLHQAALSLATPQIRNAGTVGGNLCQRPRCWYFRNAQIICRKKGGSQCYAFRGKNKYHAIFGGGVCFIVYPSDLAPALIALDVQAVIGSPRGEKTMPLADFYALPSKNVRRENVLGPDEILREVNIPPAKKGDKSVYVKLTERGTWDFALVSAAVRGTAAGSGFSELRIVMGGVAPIPWRMPEVEDALKNKKISPALVKEASRAALAGARPLAENGFKKQLVTAVLTRALMSLV